MGRYIARRLVQAIPMLLLLSMGLFLLVNAQLLLKESVLKLTTEITFRMFLAALLAQASTLLV